MPRKRHSEVAPERFSGLPEALRKFLSGTKRVIQADDGDWMVSVKEPPAYLVKWVPQGALLIANNGCGDHLFLVPGTSAPASFAPKVQVYWHEGPHIEVFAEDVAALIAPPPPAPTKRPPVLYHDGTTMVQVGDEVSARSLFLRREGRVVYVPGMSNKKRDMEFNGLCWVGIKFHDGTRTGVVVDPKSSRLRKSVRLLGRSGQRVPGT